MTETEEVVANPDGSFTLRSYERPVRVRSGAGWTPVDTTLVVRSDGTIAPRAAAVDLAISGGGAGSAAKPLVRMAHQGKEVGLGWSSDLPVPRLDGPVATYPEVLPGVDLRVTADVLGFSEVLVVKSAEAARNPALRKVSFRSHTKGTRVRAVPGAASADKPNLEVLDDAGAPVFTGGSTRMWDSGDDGGRGAGKGRRTAAMGTELGAGTVSIVPDQAFLNDPATTYPVFLDPDYSCSACGKAAHTVVQSGYPNAANWNATGGSLNDLKSGYQTTDSSGISRTYLRMNSSAIAGKDIKWATLNTTLNYSWWGSANAKPTELYLVNPIGPGTTWNAQPGGWVYQGNSNTTNQGQAANVAMQFPATAAATSSAAGGWPDITFLLKGEQEGNTYSWRRFGLNPYLEVHYNSVPNNPVGHAMERGSVPCVKGANRPWIATKTPTVQAWVSDPDGGSLGVKVATSGGPYGQDTPGSYRDNFSSVPWIGTPGPNAGALAQVTVPAGWIGADGIYKWAVKVTDGERESPRWDWDCEFSVDSTVPLAPVLAPSNSPQNQGDTAAFTVKVDMATSGFYDIDRFVYTTDGSEPSTQGSPSVAAVQGTDSAGKPIATAALNTTAVYATQNLVKVRAVNKAGTPGPNASCAGGLVASGASCAYVVAPLTSAALLKGAWSIDDTWGTSASDQVGALNPGQTPHPLALRGDAAWAQGWSKGNSWTQTDELGLKDGTRGGMFLTSTGFLETSAPVLNTAQSFSVAAWVYMTDANTFHTVLSQDGNSVSSFFLQYNHTQNKWAVVMPSTDQSGVAATVATSSDSSAVPLLNTWTHLTATYDAPAKQVSLYVDGRKVGSATGSTAAWNATGPFVFGAGKYNGNRVDHFPGTVDDAQAWQRVLSPQDVHDLANTAVPRAAYGLGEGAGPKLATGATGNEFDGDYVPAPVPSLQGYWKFDEGTGTTTADSSNNGAGYENNMITTGAQWVPGKTGTALRYNGTTGSFSHSTSRAVNTSQSFTVSAWVKLGSLQGYQAVVGQSGTTRPGFQLRYSPDVQAWIFGLNREDSSSTATDWVYRDGSATTTGTWTMVTGVYNNDSKQLLMYLDGVLVAQRSYGGVPWDATGNVTVGAYEFSGNPVHPFNGDIDNVQLWQRALTASQVAGLAGRSYSNGTWSLGTPTATASGSVAQVATADAAYTEFTGSGGRVAWTRPDFLYTTKSYTVEAWVRDDGITGTGTAVTIADASGSPMALERRSEAGGRWAFTITGPGGRTLFSDAAPTGLWTHLAGSYDATTKTACFWVNGQLQATERTSSGAAQGVTGCSTGVSSQNNWGQVVAGAGNASGTPTTPWRGGLAGIRLYAGLRVEKQIKDDQTTDDPRALFRAGT
ncbi:LamG domain-containing protein [Actinokineospora bangkokensis]|uniref:LamG domain-containing protein n=1 Tax=Actinokineospora bangkokensis TaxID=1193682 RepID=UPI001177A198|nr:LamG domain-containing protein [Actinokineospora bangkokensis]